MKVLCTYIRFPNHLFIVMIGIIDTQSLSVIPRRVSLSFIFQNEFILFLNTREIDFDGVIGP